MKFLGELWQRVFGHPVPTLVGSLIGAVLVGLQSAIGTIDWTNTRHATIVAIQAAIPTVIGALMKSAPPGSPAISAATQQVSEAVSQALEEAVINATNNAINEIQKIGGIKS
jgi:hypothetical protein